jgi:hypothetical protein
VNGGQEWRQPEAQTKNRLRMNDPAGGFVLILAMNYGGDKGARTPDLNTASANDSIKGPCFRQKAEFLRYKN